MVKINKERDGQVWIETVLYTLIGIVLIGLTLTFAGPKIREKQDQVAIEQALTTLDKINENVNIRPANTREVFVLIKKGELRIDSLRDRITFYFDDLSKPYSEIDVPVEKGNKLLLSKQGQKNSEIEISLRYGGKFNISYGGSEEEKIFSAAPVEYKIFIKNLGDVNGDGIEDIVIRESGN